MCEVMRVSRSGYDASAKRLVNPKPDQGSLLVESVQRIHQESDESYGSRRMSKQLKAEGYEVGRFNAKTLMKKANVKARTKKKFKRVTTQSNHDDPVARNLLEQKFEADPPKTVWVGDITYLWTAEGWFY